MTVRHAIPLLAGVASLAAAGVRRRVPDRHAGRRRFVSAPAAKRAKALDYAHGMGVTYLRITMVWEGFRNDGFAPYDAADQRRAQAGMTVQLTVTGNPRFTKDGQGYLGYRNPSPSRYGRWIGQVARHFRGRVAVVLGVERAQPRRLPLPPDRPPPRRRPHHLRPAGARRLQRGQARRPRRQGAHRRGRALDLPLRFIERAARALPGGLRADGWAQHPYQFLKISPGRPQRRYTGGISNVGAMKSLDAPPGPPRKLRTRSGAPLPIYFTEFGYPRPGAYYGFFSEALRNRYTLEAFRLAKRSGAKVLVWYQLYNNPGRARAGSGTRA